MTGCFRNELDAMQRRHSSNTEGMPPERSRSQTLGSESSLDEGGVFDCLKPDPSPSSQQLFTLVGVPSVPSASLQAAGLVLASSPEVFIQMTASSREEGGRSEVAPYLPRPPPHYNHHHHHPFQHRSSLLHATSAGPGERHGGREDASDDPSTPAPALSELKAVVTWLQRGFPFIVILLAKVCFQHKLGGEVNVDDCLDPNLPGWECCVCVLHLQHRGAVQQVSVAMCPLTLLMFAKPNINSFDFFSLIWAVGITDFILKFFTIGLKCFILFLPKIFLAFKLRGKVYLLLEELSQLFRALVPIQLWCRYFLGEEPTNSYFLEALLIIIYSLCKSFDLCGRVSSLCKALAVLCSSQSYGLRASSQQCSEAGDVCAICQADFREPLVLHCQHVFCEECLCLWFDRERACPLCRSSVTETLRCWKDGTTSAHFQIY